MSGVESLSAQACRRVASDGEADAAGVLVAREGEPAGRAPAEADFWSGQVVAFVPGRRLVCRTREIPD